MSFPLYKADEEPKCFHCGETLPGPDKDSGYAWRYGALQRKCAKCERITWFDRA